MTISSFLRRAGWGGALTLTALLGLAGASSAASYTVLNTGSAGADTLRGAIEAAQADGDPSDTITFAPSVTGTISLDGTELAISKDLTIVGPGANVLTLDAGGNSPVFNISGSTVAISGLTLANGNNAGNGSGGIDNEGTLTLTACTLSSNIGNGNGGGIYNHGTLTVTACTLSDNRTPYNGGGIFNNGGMLTITASTFSGNSASYYGGGIENANGGTLTVTASTFYGNSAVYGGGGIENFSSTNTTLTACLFTGSTGGDLDGRFTSGGSNLLGNGDGNGITNGVNHDQTGVSAAAAKLGPLQDNGGPTSTCALLTGSPAIDADYSTNQATDQRGFGRPVGVRNDSGAFEYGAVAPSRVLSVPSDYGSIQTAINNANSGDTILIADGTYTGSGNVDLDTLGKNLTFQSVHGAASTIIDCQGASNNYHIGFNVHNGETVSFSGLTIRNGLSNYSSGAIIRTAPGAGINSSNHSIVTIENCTFVNDVSQYAAVFNSRATLTMDGVTVRGGNYGITNESSSTMTLSNCQVSNNSGIGIYNIGTGTLTNCVMSNNSQFGFFGYTNSTLTNCTLGGNQFGFYAQGTMSLINVIAWDGSLPYVSAGTVLSAKHCDIKDGLPSGTADNGGNIDADPKFVSSSDLHLQPGSPCAAAGTSTNAPTTDLDGTIRPNLPTIGAYEGQAAPLVTLTSLLVTSTGPSVLVGGTQQFTATATYSDSTTADVTASATWISDNTNTVTIDASGLATGIAPGTANINAVLNGYQSTTDVLTVTAPVFLPSYSYQALWSNTNGSFSVWNVANGGRFVPHDFDATPGFTAQALAATPDGHAHVLLTASTGAITLEDANTAALTRLHNTAAQASYGPFPGWTAHTLAAGPDGVLRVLWTRTDGMLSLWKLHADGTYAHREYGPYAGWTPRFFAAARDNTLRIVWTRTDGQMSFWVMDAAGGYTHAEYGPYVGWTPTALATGPDGVNIVSWSHTADGMASFWALQDSGQFQFANFGPYTDWRAGSLAVGADNIVHVGWTEPSGVASLWDLSRLNYHFANFGPYSDWHLQGLAAAGTPP